MSDMTEYDRLMQEQRRGTSAQFPPTLDDSMLAGSGIVSSEPTVLSVGEPTVSITEDKPMTEDEIFSMLRDQRAEDAEIQKVVDRMGKRQTLERLQERGELLGYSPELLTQTAGDILYTGAATGRYLIGEEGAGADAAMGVGFMALPFSPLILRSMNKGLQKAAKSMQGLSADTLRKNLAAIDDRATERLSQIAFDLKAGKITQGQADLARKNVEGAASRAVNKAEIAFRESRTGGKTEMTRRAEHAAMNEARVAEGKAPLPYKPPLQFGTGGMMEEPLTKPFLGGGPRAGAGRKGAQVKTVEDEMREARQVVDRTTTRLPTASERKQLDELGEIVTVDPKATRAAVVDESGRVLVGKPGMKAAKDAPDPYPGETAEIIARMPLTPEATRGVSEGTIGMSDSLVNDLSILAKKEFPAHFDERRLVVDPGKYYDSLSLEQQQQVLAKAKEMPGLGRDLARHERALAEAATINPGDNLSPEARDKLVRDIAKRRATERADDLTRSEAQAALKGKRRAVGTTEQLKKRVVREGEIEGLPQKQFLTDLKDMSSRFSPDEMKFIEQQVKRGDMPATAEALDQFEQMKQGLNVVYDKRLGEYVTVQKKSPTTPTRRKAKPDAPPAESSSPAKLPTLGKAKVTEAKADDLARRRGLAKKKKRTVEAKSDKK
tara:strand:- start:1636 stop:3627 length:1992 start_codon:yes stop_codon:yes gene_type:complete